MAKRKASSKLSRTAARKAAQPKVAVTCPCESSSNALINGIVLGTSFGVLLGLITGNMVLWLPVCIALGIAFGQFFKC